MTSKPHPHPPPPPYLGETPRQSLQRKIPFYLLGLAIGCILVGIMVMARSMATKRGPDAQQSSGQSVPASPQK